MSRHSIKCWPAYFKLLRSGEKTYEIRKNDRDYQVGDILEIKEWDPDTYMYTGEVLEYRVTHLMREDDPFGIPGVVIMSLRRIRDRVPETVKCRSCGADIFFRKTRAGKVVPLNPEIEMRFASVGRGLVALVHTYSTHFVTCPSADEHRKK